MIGIRKSLDLLFSKRELKILDDVMPEITRKQRADDLHHLEGGAGGEVGLYRKFLTCCIGEKNKFEKEIDQKKKLSNDSKRKP